MSKRLQLTIEGERGAISFETFATVVRNSFDILSDLDSAVSSLPRGSLEWFVTDVSYGSLSIAIEPKSKLQDMDYSRKVTETFVDGLMQIQKEHTTPPYFSDYGLRKAQSVAKALKKNGAEAVRVFDVERETTAIIRPEAALDLARLINVRYQEIGSVEGKLEMISIHGAPRFTVYHSITQRSVKCKFSTQLLDTVKDGLGRRVIVKGMVHFNYIHEPVKVDMESLTLFPMENELPVPRDIKGIAPDFTGGKESGEYVRSLRDG